MFLPSLYEIILLTLHMGTRNTAVKKDNILIFEQRLPEAEWFACDCFLFTLFYIFTIYTGRK